MRYSKIKPNDVVNGEGISVSLFTQGCTHKCEGCFNPETWDVTKGIEFTEFHKEHILKLLDKNGINRNLSILGGEPLLHTNIGGVIDLCEYIKSKRPNTIIYVWTGYLYDNLLKHPFSNDLFKNIDYLIDGKFDYRKKDLGLYLRGSSNQRVIDIQKTLIENKIILYKK